MSLSAEKHALSEFDVAAVRADFPILERQVHGKPLIYFDTAASAQRPKAVIDAISQFYNHYNANIHRGVHALSQEATEAYETSRMSLVKAINAKSRHELVFTRGTTESINLVAQSFLRPRVGPGDEIVVTHMEHHSNIVPWQLACEQTGASLKVVPINDQGELELEQLKALLSEKVKMLALGHISNALGTINPVQAISSLAKAYDIPVLVDGAQAMPHQTVDVQALGCDFYCFSGHKMYGPTGIGCLWARESLLEEMPPYQGGGEMIRHVTFDETVYAELPGKFEAGTPNIAGGIGLGAAIEYIQQVGYAGIAEYEQALLSYATGRMQEVDGLRIIGTAANKASVISFALDDVHAHDLGTVIDHYGIAVRTGHHCAMPVMQHFNVPATTRVSLGMYNTRHEIDQFIDALQKARQMFA